MILVSVTKHHIQLGKRRSFGYCPIALAILDVTKRKSYVHENEITIGSNLNTESDPKYIPIPKSLQEVIREFDETGNMIPFEFELDY